MSTHIWELKARGSTFDVKWKGLDRGAPSTPVTGRCNLCTKEKCYILRKPEMASLNSRKEQNMQNRGAPFTPVTGRCNLCTKEKFYIFRKPEMASLNSRQEVGNHCRHIAMSFLSNVGKVKVPG